jgi:hypothetical protein
VQIICHKAGKRIVIKYKTALFHCICATGFPLKNVLKVISALVQKTQKKKKMRSKLRLRWYAGSDLKALYRLSFTIYATSNLSNSEVFDFFQTTFT